MLTKLEPESIKPQEKALVRHNPELAPATTSKLIYLEPVQEETASQPRGAVDFWELLKNRKRTLALVMGLMAALALIVSLFERPVFLARTTLEIQTPGEVSPSLPGMDGAFGAAPDNYMQTQVRILQSRTLQTRVAASFKASGEARWSPEPSRLVSWMRLIGVELPGSGNSAVNGLPPTTVTVKPFDNTRLVEVMVESPDPAFAAEYANRLSREFRDLQMEARWSSAQESGKWLTGQIEEVKNSLRRSEQELEAYSRRAGITFTSDQQSVDQEKLKQLQGELSRANADRVLKQSAYETAQQTSADTVPQVADDGRLSEYRAKLAELRREQAELTSQLTPEHYKVKRIAAQIAEVESTLGKERENILTRVKNDYKASQRREALLRAAYEGQKRVVSGQTERGVYYDVLKHEVDSNRKLYDELLEKGKGVGIASAARMATVRVVDAADKPLIPYKPDFVKNLLMGTVAGMLLGVLFVAGSDYVNRSLRAPGETAFHLHVPELGVIPDYDAAASRAEYRRKTASLAIGPGSPAGSTALAAWQSRPEIVAESFRSTLTSILLSSQHGKRPRVLVLTSAGREEGKSTTVSNLGIALAEINQRVLLIDADMRKPQLHHVFGVANTWGLSDLLKERNPLAEVPLEALVRPTSIPNLYVLPSGPGITNIANLLHSDRVAALVARLREEFNTILIDTPPMSYISDARMLAKLADAVVLVVRAGQTTRDEALAVKQRLTIDGIQVMGTILNRWDPKSKARYATYPYSRPESA
jgi:polysaccharide biosynthesis transport protein